MAQTGEGARDTADKASSGEVAAWVKGLARFGYAAKGVVYAIIGVLAAQVAFRGEVAVRQPGSRAHSRRLPINRSDVSC